MPGAREVLRRAVGLLKPGGWIIVEDPDDSNMVDGGKPLGPGMGAFVGAWLDIVRSRGAEPCFGRFLEDELKAIDSLVEVNVKKVTIPISGKSEGMIPSLGPTTGSLLTSLPQIPRRTNSVLPGRSICSGWRVICRRVSLIRASPWRSQRSISQS